MKKMLALAMAGIMVVAMGGGSIRFRQDRAGDIRCGVQQGGTL